MNHSATRRGSNSVQPAGTEPAEATRQAKKTARVAGRVSGEGGTAFVGGERGTGKRPNHDRAGTGDSLRGVDLPSPGQATDDGSGKAVTGIVIGSTGAARQGDLAFGAPGLHGSGADDDAERALATAIGIASLLIACGGAVVERRRRESPS